MDRRASAALEPPSLDWERRSTVAMSLAGLFDDPGVPEAAEEPPQPRKNPEPWNFDEEEEEAAPTARQRRGLLRAVLSPGGILAVVAVVAAVFVVGYFVSRANPPTPPRSDQVTLLTRSH
jgi:hypothetical protein